MITILWVEDQFYWIDKFKPVLEETDFQGGEMPANGKNTVHVFKFIEAAQQFIRQEKQAPDIVILDANMNGDDDAGFMLSTALSRKWPDVPVIYLSEHSGTGIEQKAFEEIGARDFIAKHQQNIEAVLCWRIRAIIQRKQAQNSEKAARQQHQIVSGGLTIDTLSWNVYWQGERLMNPNNPKRPLAPTPRKILRYLVEASPQPLTTFQIAEKLDADLEKFSYASYRQHIKTLRHSIEQAGAAKNAESFISACQSGQGIVTFGDEGAYCWVPIVERTE